MMSVSVCLPEYLSASTFPEPHVRRSLFFMHVTISSWLGLPQAALRCVMYFRFHGWPHICTSWAIWRHVDTVAASDVKSSRRCAQDNAPAASHWLRRVPDRWRRD